MAQPLAVPGSGDVLLNPRIFGLRLDMLVSGARFASLDRLDAYATCRQYDHRKYNWDGNLMGYAGEADIAPGWYVPLAHRRPRARFELGKLITRRLTAMALGEDSWPEITVEGDEEAEDFAKALAEEAKLETHLQEARNKGGACGTAVVSFGFLEGEPRVKVHDAKHMYPLRWKDRENHVLGAVLKAYKYNTTVWGLDGKPKLVDFFYARYWDELQEVVWDPIPLELARSGRWATQVANYRVVHGFGECPVYWAQNLPESEQEDGHSDFDGLTDTFDEVNTLLSATTKGTISNVDPTLVIKDDPGVNPGVVRKGTDNAIFSKAGAEYLELKGDAVRAGKEWAEALVRYCLDTAGVVIGDPEKMGAKAQSAQALKMLYLPMCNQADILRVQYGSLIVQLLRGMLRASRLIGNAEPGAVETTADGRLLQHKPTVVLPPRIDRDEEGKPKAPVPRTPGQSERIQLKWPPYFQPTLTDVNQAVEAVTKAKGQVIGQETAIKFTAGMFGVTDVATEMASIEIERDRAAELAGSGPHDPAWEDPPEPSVKTE
jgi:hypothetical protein